MASKRTEAHFDVVYVADLRFEGGTSTAMAEEIRAAARAGLRTGLLGVKGPIIRHPFPVHTRLRELIDMGVTERLDPDMEIDTDLVLVHHPSILENYFMPRPRISSKMVVVVLHHPAVNGVGKVQYDLDRVARHAYAAFGRDIVLAPVSAIVRRTLPRTLAQTTAVMAEDWINLIDIEDWPLRDKTAVGHPIVIGRHSRPDIQKWPDTFEDALGIYPADEKYAIHILGGGEYLEQAYGTLPNNWKNLPFSFEGVPEFLKQLDFFVYFHSEAWSEAFGRTILEALAVGLVCVLPRYFEVLFGDAALYCTPSGVRVLVETYASDPALYQAQSQRARAFVTTRHAAHLYASRLARLLARPLQHLSSSTMPLHAISTLTPLPDRRCLFLSSNGIGIGHLNQQLALADRLPPSIEPVFATMSYAMKVAVEAGYQCHHFGHHHAYGAPIDAWNRHFAEELFDLTSHIKPSVLCYDATAVFGGVVNLLEAMPDVYSIWVRRPMWNEGHRRFLEHSSAFDAVIEPGELAEDFDHGPTKDARHHVYGVQPVLRHEPNQRLTRDAARKLLDVPDDTVLVVVQLGAGANFDMTGVRDAIIATLLADPDVTVIELHSPIRPAGAPLASYGSRHRLQALFPAFLYSAGFDACISAAGYNAFHESILGAIPTLFVPNEGDQMDRQVQRARWAEICGYGFLMRRDADLPRISDKVARLLDAAERSAIERRCRSIVWRNGADDIARFIEDHARLVRADRDATRMM